VGSGWDQIAVTMTKVVVNQHIVAGRQKPKCNSATDIPRTTRHQNLQEFLSRIEMNQPDPRHYQGDLLVYAL
jgi:hypothetical protein